MTLKTQLINHLRYSDGWECGADLERMEWETDNDGLFKMASVNRVLRKLREEGRLEQNDEMGTKNTIFYRYRHNEYEAFHRKFIWKGKNIEQQLESL